MDTATPSILRLDRQALKVLAHPLRSRLLTELRMHGPATATALARDLGTNTGATSYHLRRLASVGLVEETKDGHGRERPWRAATEMHGWTERDAAGDPDAEAASDWLRRHYLRSFLDHYEAWLDDQAQWPIEWQDAAGASDFVLNLGASDLAALNADLVELLQRYRDRPPSDPADARIVQLYVYAFPPERSPR